MVVAHAWKHGPRFNVKDTTFFLVIPALIWIGLAPHSNPYTPLRSLTWGVPAALLLLAALQFEKKIDFKKIPWIVLLGNASYSIYLVHTIIIPIVGKASRTLFGTVYWFEVSAVVLTSCLVGTWTYMLLEVRLLRFASSLLGIRNKH